MAFFRRTLQAVALVGTLVIGVASMAVIVTQTTWFKEWLRGLVIRQAADYVQGSLSIGRLGGNLFFGLELGDVDVTVDGKSVVAVKDVGLHYNAFSLARGYLVLDDIRLTRPVLHLRKTPQGWNLWHLIKARTPDRPANPKPIEIGEIGVSDGTVYIEASNTSGIDLPAKIDKLDASVGVTSDADELKVAIAHVSFRAEEPAFGVNDLSGVIRRTMNALAFEKVSLRTEETSLRIDGRLTDVKTDSPTVDLKVSSDKFTVSEMARLIRVLRGYEAQPAFELTMRGPLERMAVGVNLREQNLGHVIANLTVDGTAPGRRVAGMASVEHFNLAPLIPRRDGPSAPPTPLTSDVTGTTTFNLELPQGKLPLRGTYVLDASSATFAGYRARDLKARGRIEGRTIHLDANAAAYGARVAAAGTFKLQQPIEVDLTGRASSVDLRNLPPAIAIPRGPTSLQFTYTLAGRWPVLAGDAQFDESTMAGATIAAGTKGSFRVGGGAPEYSGTGQLTGLDVQKFGQGFEVAVLDDARYRSQISTTFDITGSGGGHDPLVLDATGTATDGQMFGATFPRVDFTTNWAGGDVRVRSMGQFAHLNPAVVFADDRLAGDLTGAEDVDMTIRHYASGVTIDSFDATGRVNLEPSTVADVRIDSAVFDGVYANREGNLTQLSIAGADVNVEGHGSIALNDTGASNLTLHIESPALDRFGMLIAQPLKGAAIVDATLTGNARELKAQGTLKGSNIGYADNSALALDATFNAAVPDLELARGSVEVKSAATFVQVQGQQINELTADTTYSQSTLDFKGVAKQGMRELAAAGVLTVLPDHQEIHVVDLALRSEGIEWRMAPGSKPTVQYGQDRLAVQDVKLVSADQTIEADGVVGSSTEPLRVQARNVDVALLDRVLLGEQRLAGRLTADALVTGPASAPRVAGDFTLTQGAFRQFMFESFAGKVDYAGEGVTIDVRLQQNPQAWLTAKGSAPISFLQPNPPGTGVGHEEAGPGDMIDIQIATSEIDLGLIQGFTPYVTNVTGALQANVHVTGAGHDPHLDGAIDIKGGAFAVPELGTAYTGLDTRIELKPDEVSITQMRVLDDHNQALTIGGTLSVHERDVGAVDITIKSETFEVIHNRTAGLKLDTDLRLTGELHAPRLEGSIDIHTGSINIARVLEEVTTDPYATEATQFGPPEPGGPITRLATPNFLSRLDLNIGVAVPSNLVLNGNNLKTANAAIALGDMNVTVGGLLQIRKAPGGTVQVNGEVNTVRGTYNFQGRRFEILREGRIRFTNTDELNPLLDLQARRLISGIELVIHVRGTLQEPELSFTSTPPLDEADILSLIVFNQPINELGTGQQASLAQRAGALAGGYLASGLASSIGNALSLDEFQIQAEGEGGGPQLIVGEQVGDNVFFRIRQGFGNVQATEFILEYQIRQYLRLQGSVADAQTATQRNAFRRIERGGLDLIFFFSY